MAEALVIFWVGLVAIGVMLGGPALMRFLGAIPRKKRGVRDIY